ncbi:MAG: sensor histidine kinase, partial [Gemmatimonadales bacterium]
GEFLASMSHELRTPLNSVIGFANVLLKNKDGNLQATDLHYLERIRDNGQHLLELINDVLDLSKIEVGKMEAEVEQLALDELVAQTLEELRGAVRDGGVVLRAVLPDEMAPIATDPRKLKQILINLLGNALKFTEKGEVTVSSASASKWRASSALAPRSDCSSGPTPTGSSPRRPSANRPTSLATPGAMTPSALCSAAGWSSSSTTTPTPVSSSHTTSRRSAPAPSPPAPVTRASA